MRELEFGIGGKLDPECTAVADRVAQWEARYRSGPRPWDTGITPPEVETFWQSGLLATAGVALDLGCGTGTNACRLARAGLTAIGVDLALTALAEARGRAAAGPAGDRAHFIQADVARLPFAELDASYILDIGCLHGLPLDLRPAYAAGVKANLAAGGYYHLYCFDRASDAPTGEPLRGMFPGEVEQLFSPEIQVLVNLPGKMDRLPSRWLLMARKR